MSQFQLALTISYLIMSGYFFTNWLTFSLRHPASSPEDKFLSFIMFLITSVLWPLIIPMSCLQIIQKGKIEFSTIVPVLLAIFAVSISFYLSQFPWHGFCYYDFFCAYAS